MDNGWRRNKKTGGLFNINDINDAKKNATNKYMNDKIRKLSNKKQKEYTEKDIKKLYEYWGGSDSYNAVRGYELNGFYLLKNNPSTDSAQSWIIREGTDERVALASYYSSFNIEPPKDIIYVNSFKEGKEKLIKLANGKNKKRD